ncbi:hypothetical protein [Haloferax sp. ATB1]|uniref:hypothetical protein n=1 Tax=Haloferax sp. ATB1 TaxID=1508454 RepID=UPI00069372E8|nr:hypothetical protein [Haloferax sp. ATB1]
MDRRDLESFFDLGNSQKSTGIGYKGHGTKIYYKSDQVRVTTAQSGTQYTAVLNEPWSKLNRGILPEYTIETTETDADPFTHIEITGFRAGRGFDAEELTYNRLSNYINWKTIGGSIAHQFDHESREMDIAIELDDDIDSSTSPDPQPSILEFPDEKLTPDAETVDEIETLCKHYEPQTITKTVEGQTVTIQIAGFVAGRKARDQLPTHGRHSTQFGVWLAKDHIKVEQINSTVSSDNQYLQFFFVANCPQLELTANRERVRNKADPIYDAILGEVEWHMTKVTQSDWYREYQRLRQRAVRKQDAASQSTSLTERKQQLSLEGPPVPSNVSELLVHYTRYTANDSGDIVSIDHDGDVNVLLHREDELYAVAAVQTLHSFFSNEKTVENVDQFICWSLGDLDYLRELERTDYFGSSFELQLQQDRVVCEIDSREVPITVVKELV